MTVLFTKACWKYFFPSLSMQCCLLHPAATYDSLQENPAALVTPGWFHSHCNFLTLSDRLLESLVLEVYAQCTLLNRWKHCESIVLCAFSVL